MTEKQTTNIYLCKNTGMDWADVKSFADVSAVGKAYLQGKVRTNPWSGFSECLEKETTAPASIKTLLALHDRGVLTVDSQSGCRSGSCSIRNVEQKSYVEGFIDRRRARAFATQLSKVPGTVVFVYIYASNATYGNFRTPSKKQLGEWADEYWVLTRVGPLGMPRVNKWNPARAAHSPISTAFKLGKRIATSELALAKSVHTGEYAGGSKRLHDIIRGEAAFFQVYNTEFGARPEASTKMLQVLKRM